MFTKKKLTANKGGIRLSQKQKRESWLPEDEEWLKNHPNIKLDRANVLDTTGTEGTVIALNQHFVIKVPKGYISGLQGERDLDDVDFKQSRRDIMDEIEFYNKNKTNEEALFIPAKSIKLSNKTPSGNDQYGIIKPMLRVSDRALRNLSNDQLEQLRQKVIDVSEKGYKIMDGLQVGIDKKGRIQLYDAGFVVKKDVIGKENTFTKEMVYSHNNDEWIRFLRRIDKPAFWKYGSIKPRK